MIESENTLRPSEIATTLQIHTVAAAPSIPSAICQRIDSLWEEARARRGDEIYNGRIFSVTQHSRARIEGYFTDYKQYLAQRADPALLDVLGIKLLAVSGLVCTADGDVVFARRSATVSGDVLRWELAPSGVFDSDDLLPDGTLSVGSCVGRELFEELNVPSSSIVSHVPFLLVHHTVTHGYDLGVRVEVTLSSAEVRAAFANRQTDEYLAVEVVPWSKVDDFVSRHSRDLIGVSRLLLSRCPERATRPA